MNCNVVHEFMIHKNGSVGSQHMYAFKSLFIIFNRDFIVGVYTLRGVFIKFDFLLKQLKLIKSFKALSKTSFSAEQVKVHFQNFKRILRVRYRKISDILASIIFSDSTMARQACTFFC